MTGSLDDHVQLDSTALDTMETGTELDRGGHLLLALLGLIIPVVLLVWGWLL